ncbi:DUF3141 domain-containing protein [Jeongeupia naejangsanensis]|uniref:DUF3141 domain-containing protein n=1 Tax=Jeongeupia naejangsanensis TaxID=613195 RepID=A0ABS2BJL8_9NEIS|nr:DUF3141 domain-containing protein [Jeongeupia naejangsanensis]MBM3115783.1 DUF3141 domain-containing protein [Jeongeupia naejangsanensis]
MLSSSERLATASTLPVRLGLLWQRRIRDALTRFAHAQTLPQVPFTANPFFAAFDYLADSFERQTLFWDTFRQRGDNYLEHAKAGKPPLLHFSYDIIVDGRQFKRPVNYALAAITPPEGVVIDPEARPYVIIDPRAGHGPGIGGFKDDSEVGMALRAGSPVYFCLFFPEPEAGQTLADVTAAEADFLREVIRRHPDSPKPALVGNCQGGWAAMLVAAQNPELVGALVMNGAPVSYWAGNDGGNPMRYAGGNLGGAWTALLASDLGKGKFDGAYLVDNFEGLDPANTLVKKNYHLYDQIDTEPPRFLEFERWWGGYFLMNEEEIRWIVENLFIGNNLTEGKAVSQAGAFDLRQLRAPVVVFASMGDNITPPQQAFNWILDLYPNTAALKHSGQVIVGLEHKTTGHLGIFVSAKIAQKEHAKIVELLQVIETLEPGLYQLKIDTVTGDDGQPRYEAELIEREVEELRGLQKFERHDEAPFAAVEAISTLGTSIYSTLVRPWLAPLVTEDAAEIGRQLHPLRVQHWGWSSYNPLAKLNAGVAEVVREHRQPREPELRSLERWATQQLATSLDLYRDLRDATSELQFFHTYGLLGLAGIGVENIPDYLKKQGQAEPQFDDAALLARLPKGDNADGLIRLAILITQGLSSIKVERRSAAYEWLLQEPALAALAPETRHAKIREQALLAWRFPAEARKTLPQLFDSRDALASAFEHFDALVHVIPDSTEALHNLAELRAEVLPTRTVTEWPAAKTPTAAPPADEKPARTVTRRKPAASKPAATPTSTATTTAKPARRKPSAGKTATKEDKE